MNTEKQQKVQLMEKYRSYNDYLLNDFTDVAGVRKNTFKQKTIFHLKLHTYLLFTVHIFLFLSKNI